MATATSKTRRTAGKVAAKPASKRTAATARAANAKKAAPVKAAASKTRTAKVAGKVAGRKATQKPEPAAASTRKSPERRSHVEKIKIGKSIVARMAKGETMGEVARDLQLYPFQAHQLVGLYHVDKGDVPAITGRTEDVLVKRLAAARAKGDEYASWDWLAARSGINKVKIQKMLTEAGHDISDVRTARGARKEAAPVRGRKVTSKRGSQVVKSARTASKNRAARAATKPAPAQATRPPAKAAPRSESKAAKAARLAKRPERNASGRVTAGERTRRRAARIDKVKAKVEAAPAKAAAKAKAATKAAPVTRKRTPVNVPRGARPTAADPS